MTAKTNALLELRRYGQSVWMDNFRRGWIESGELHRLIVEDGLSGVTTNPTIFEKAVSGGVDYDDAIHELVNQGKNTQQIYEDLMIEDIRMAADAFRSTYYELEGTDGFVSIELPPALAHDTESTIHEALRWHAKIERENIFIKVPGTLEGIAALERLTYEGLNINITLLFSVSRYEEIARAYVRGLQRRLAEGKSINRIASVASFFVSRIDTEIDRRLETMLSKAKNERRGELESLFGKAAIANAKMAYQRFKAIFSEPAFKDLELHGARPQRVLWASTSTKNPRYPDVYYAEALVGPQTVDTLPTQTMFAFKNHGKVFPGIEENLVEAEEQLKLLTAVGISLDEVTAKLEEEGIKSFQKSVDDLMDRLRTKFEAITKQKEGRQMLHIGDYQARVEYTLEALGEQGFSKRLWEKDTSLWKQGPESQKVIKNRLGWLDIVETMLERSSDIVKFVDEVKAAGFTHAVLMGMGGSSLSPEVSRLSFGVKPGYLSLFVLDTTVPDAVIDIEKQIVPEKTLFIVSTKSGGTVETLSAYKYFFDVVSRVKGDKAGGNFVAVTDPGSSLEQLAADKKFRRTFLNFQDIGGRYSALSYFGILPAAIIGVDIDLLLHRAWTMVESSSSFIAPMDNPGIVLGTVMGELAQEGRNKLTLILSPEIESFGLWVEQLVAESTGKNGAGVIPIHGEAIASTDQYGDDRLFVYLKLKSSSHKDLDAKVHALELAGMPVVRILLDDVYDLGQEYFRWEVATAVASAILGVNAFDEPNVTESKNITNRLLGEFKANGKLPEKSLVIEEDGVSLYCDDEMKNILDKIRAAGPYAEDTLLSYMSAYLDEFQPGNYFAMMAFLSADARVDEIFKQVSSNLTCAYSAATTFGYGPRFLHSTGQLHKGGPNTGIFIQFTVDDTADVTIPGEPYTFSTLKQAQSMGDGIALRDKGRPMIRLHLGKDAVEGLNHVAELICRATSEQPL